MVDEVHHLPALADTDPDTAARTDEEQASAWSQAILPLLECATVRLLLSGTLERADGKSILWLPYRKGVKARTREIELDASGRYRLFPRPGHARACGAAGHLWRGGRRSALARRG